MIRAVHFVHAAIAYRMEWERTEMPHLNHIVDATLYLKCQIYVCESSYQLNWIGSAIYNTLILFLSIAHCPVRKTTMSVWVSVLCIVYYIPTIIHFIETVCGRIFNSVFAVNASMQCLIYMSKAIIVCIRDSMWSVDQPNEFMCIKWICTHTHTHTSRTACPPWVCYMWKWC